MDIDSQPDISNRWLVAAHEELAAWQERHGITCKELAESFGVSERAVSYWRSPGNGVPPWLAAIVDCDEVPAPVRRLQGYRRGLRRSMLWKRRMRAAAVARAKRERAEPDTRGSRARVLLGDAGYNDLSCGGCGGLLVRCDSECPACGRELDQLNP